MKAWMSSIFIAPFLLTSVAFCQDSLYQERANEICQILYGKPAPATMTVQHQAPNHEALIDNEPFMVGDANGFVLAFSPSGTPLVLDGRALCGPAPKDGSALTQEELWLRTEDAFGRIGVATDIRSSLVDAPDNSEAVHLSWSLRSKDGVFRRDVVDAIVRKADGAILVADFPPDYYVEPLHTQIDALSAISKAVEVEGGESKDWSAELTYFMRNQKTNDPEADELLKQNTVRAFFACLNKTNGSAAMVDSVNGIVIWHSAAAIASPMQARSGDTPKRRSVPSSVASWPKFKVLATKQAETRTGGDLPIGWIATGLAFIAGAFAFGWIRQRANR